MGVLANTEDPYQQGMQWNSNLLPLETYKVYRINPFEIPLEYRGLKASKQNIIFQFGVHK